MADAIIRQSWAAFDTLLEKAFATPSSSRSSTPIPSPVLDCKPLDTNGPQSDKFETPLVSPVSPVLPPPLEVSVESIWDEVRRHKERVLAALPSKVPSLEKTELKDSSPGGKKQVKRKASVTFQHSSDGHTVTATFELPGVKKQDMHVCFRTGRLIVSWRIVRIVECQEGEVLVRNRDERKYSHTIPLPDGITFDEIRASRDGRRLKLTYPNSPRPRSPLSNVMNGSSGQTEFHSCI